MNKAVEVLFKEKKRLESRESAIRESIWSLEKIDYDSKVIEKLTKEEDELSKEVDKINKMIEMYQGGCEHTDPDPTNWEYAGHNSHHSYYQCQMCGKRYKY